MAKVLRFLIPGRLAVGFLAGCFYVFWLAIERKPVFDSMVSFVVDFMNTVSLL